MIIRFLVFVVAVFVLVVSAKGTDGDALRTPRSAATVCQLAAAQGFGCNNYWTVDGYGLLLQRIISANGTSVNGPPVVLQHGFLDSAATWVLNARNESLAFILADSGFDVWLANSRGDGYSMRNIHWSPIQPQFWAWNWDQMASFDVPAIVNYVTSFRQVAKISWIGHSQGATISIAAFSNSNLNSSQGINLFVALAPVTYLTNQQSKLMKLIAALHIDFIARILGDGDLILSPKLVEMLLPFQCAITPHLCNDLLTSLFGPTNNIDQNRMDIYLSHFPAPTSVQNFVHWVQNVRSGRYQKYNNGPDYQPQLIRCPTYVFSGTNDYLADTQDMQTLLGKLLSSGSLLGHSVVPGYAHMDFTWAENAQTNVYSKLLSLLRTATPSKVMK